MSNIVKSIENSSSESFLNQNQNSANSSAEGEDVRKSSQSVAGPKDPLLVNLQISEQLLKDSKFTKQAVRLKNCSQSYNVFMCDCGFIKVLKRCNYRICPVCGKIRSFKFFKKFIGFIKEKRIARSIYDKGMRFLTLTLKNLPDLEKAIDKLNDSLTKLKRRGYWKKRVNGALGVIEVKKGQDFLWNVHAHFILDSSYLDMKSHKKTGEDSELVKEWRICTGDSGILDIRRVKGYEGALGYVLKYLTKGIIDLSAEEKAVFFKCTFKRRLLFTLGEFYNLPKQLKEKFRCSKCGGTYQYLPHGSEECKLFESELLNSKLIELGLLKSQPPPIYEM